MYKIITLRFNPPADSELQTILGDAMPNNAFSYLCVLIRAYNAGTEEEQNSAYELLNNLTGGMLASHILHDILTERIQPLFHPEKLFTGNVRYRIAKQDFKTDYSVPF